MQRSSRSEVESCIAFARDLIRIEALPGHEGPLAQRVLRELESLGFADAHVDEVGNVLARAPGRGAAPGLFFNTHLDHVDVGDPAQWPHPPYAAVLTRHTLFGRGAVDIKGPLAAQVHAAARFLNQPAAGDIWLTAVVQEEVGGVGARHLAPRLRQLAGARQPIVVVGEPSNNQLRRGHRGRIEISATFRGRSAHASVPRRGSNPLFALARFLEALPAVELTHHDELGPSSLAPTLLRTDQTSANVIPAAVEQTLDVRTVPGQDLGQLVEQLQRLAERTVASLRDSATSANLTAQVEVPKYPLRTYTGLERPIPADNPPYLLPSDHPALSVATQAVAECLAEGSAAQPTAEPCAVWQFATDGGHFAQAEAIPIGLGPGDESLAHTRDECIEVDQLAQAIALNHAVARALSTQRENDPG